MDTINRLAALTAQAAEEDTISVFHKKLEEPIVSTLLEFPQFVETGLLRPEFFTFPHCAYVVALILQHHQEHDAVPARHVLEVMAANELTEDQDYESVFNLIRRKADNREIGHVRKTLKAWLKHRAYGEFFTETAQESYAQGNYEAFEEILDRAKRIYDFEKGEVFGFVDAVDFLGQTFNYEWLIDGVMVAKQAMLLGGKKKTLKTAVLCDLAVSLATGTPFLGHFAVPQRRRVAFFSAESGQQDIHQRLAAILKQRGAALDKGYFYPSFTRPQLSSDEDLAKIADFAKRQEIEVVIVDPLYLTLLAGGSRETNPADLYQMGRVFGAVADAIINAGATPILSHHFKKTIAKNDTDLDLDDFSMTGAAEFARQALLIARRGSYEGPRNNQLVIRTQGFSRGDRYAVHVDEGTTEQPSWAVSVEREQETISREHKTKADQDVAVLSETVAAIAEENQGAGVIVSQIKKELGWSGAKVKKTLVLAAAAKLIHRHQEQGKNTFLPGWEPRTPGV